MKLRSLPRAALVAALVSGAGFGASSVFAQQGPGPRFDQGDRRPVRGPLTAEDRAALFDARVAAVHAGLKLSTEQEAMWPAVEQAARDGVAKMAASREQARAAQPAADPIERMRRMADASIARGEAMRKFADAAQPLYASLTEDQKRRLGMLMRRPGPMEDGGMGERPGRPPPPPDRGSMGSGARPNGPGDPQRFRGRGNPGDDAYNDWRR